MNAGRIAILVPSHNAGRLVVETIQSAEGTGLGRGNYSWIISDNASDDGSVQGLPATDPNGAPIITVRNAENVGRVENWNCALGVAERLGFTYAFFLMAGDLLHGNGLLELRDRMDHAGAALGLGAYIIVDSELRQVRTARRIAWFAPRDGIAPAAFIAQSFASGAMLLAPLSANLYRIDGPVRLRFDPRDPTHTDHSATASFVCNSGRPVIYVDRLVSRWRERPDRFHASMNHWRRLESDLQTIMACCEQARVLPDRRRIGATFLLRTMFRGRATRLETVKYLARIFCQFTSLSWTWTVRLAWRQFRYGTPWVIAGSDK